MKFPAPTGWLLGCSCAVPAIAALAADAVMRSLELKGRIQGDPALGLAPEVGLLTLVICLVGSLLPAIWLNRKEGVVVTLVYWGSLSVLNIAITIPGCSFLWG